MVGICLALAVWKRMVVANVHMHCIHYIVLSNSSTRVLNAMTYACERNTRPVMFTTLATNAIAETPIDGYEKVRFDVAIFRRMCAV